MNEILLIDKEAGWTSFDVVAKVRSAYRSKNQEVGSKRIKVGHSGTLDPFATGLLIILIGDATKKQDSFMKLDKEYEATLRLGYTSTTGDPEGKITEFPISNFQFPNESQISECLNKFIGEIEQTPPAYSAIKIDGKRAYKLAREGKDVSIPSRKIKIHKLEIMNYKFPELKICVSCSSGTYIRTLGEDIGKDLGCGAYLTQLRRTKIGKYSVEDAKKVSEIAP